MKTLLGLSGLALLALVAVILIRTLLMTSKQISPCEAFSFSFSREGAGERLGSAIKFLAL